MEYKFWIISYTLMVASVLGDRFQIVDLLSETVEKLSENVFYVVVDCDDYSLRKSVHILEEVRKKVTRSQVNVIIEPFSPNVARPSIFARTFPQLLDALENHACDGKISYQGWEWSAKTQSILRRIKEQAQPQDAIFVFTNGKLEEWKEIIRGRGVPVNIIWTGSINVPEILKDAGSQTSGQILADSDEPILHVQNISGKNSVKFEDTSKYKHSIMTRSLNGNTRTEMPLPAETVKMFLTVEGNVQKALLIPPSGIIINITPERSQNFNKQYSHLKQENFFIFYDTPIKKSPEQWTFVADGNQYSMSLLSLLAKEVAGDEPAIQNRNDKMPFDDFAANEQKSMNQRGIPQVSHISNNAADPTKRLDIGNSLPLMKDQRSDSMLPDSLIAGFLTKIDVDRQSTFYAFPGEEVQIIFQVTNNKPMPYIHEFNCFYQQLPCVLQPQWVELLPQQKIQVTVITKAIGSDGSSSVLTFISDCKEDYAEKKVHIYVGKQRSDTRNPDIDYEYNGNCDDADTGSTCHLQKWSANLWAKDSDSGLLNFWSEPPGLIYTTEFIVGTRERVSARFTASCCNPKVDILASDLRGNTNKIILNVERIHFSALEIAAMVLGGMLLIILVVGIVYGLVRWRRRRKERVFLG